MKFWIKLSILFALFLGNYANAEPFKVLVLPVDLTSVCENYYCFPEASEVFATDVINDFKTSKKITTFDIYEIRKRLSTSSQIKPYMETALNQYKNSNSINFAALKKISEEFNVNSILLISSSVNNTNTKRNIWEVLEVTTAFDAYNLYSLETNAVLIDNVNDIVMWSNKYKRSLGNNEVKFWAKNTTDANSHLEKIRLYSKEIVAKNISENVILRFYPKTITTEISKPISATQTKDFRPNALEGINTHIQNNDYGEIQSEAIFNF